LCYDHKFFIDYNNSNYYEKFNDSYPKKLKQIEYLFYYTDNAVYNESSGPEKWLVINDHILEKIFIF
jgi:hypothetical protein